MADIPEVCGEKGYEGMVDEIIEESEGVQMADTILREVSADEKMRSILKSREKFERDTLARMNFTRKEGMELGERIGMEKGQQIGLEKGQRIGMEKGERIGKEKARAEITEELAEKLKAMGVDPAILNEITGMNGD